MSHSSTQNAKPKRASSGGVDRALEAFRRTESAEDAATALEIMRLSGAGRRERSVRQFGLDIRGGYVPVENDDAIAE